MNIFEMYADISKHDDLSVMFTYAAQNRKSEIAANFLEKDVWVTEMLRLLYDERLLGDCTVAFKGGTALSKCWSAMAAFFRTDPHPVYLKPGVIPNTKFACIIT